MTKLERIKVKIEAIEDDPTTMQLMGLIKDIVDIIDKKERLGFKDDK